VHAAHDATKIWIAVPLELGAAALFADAGENAFNRGIALLQRANEHQAKLEQQELERDRCEKEEEKQRLLGSQTQSNQFNQSSKAKNPAWDPAKKKTRPMQPITERVSYPPKQRNQNTKGANIHNRGLPQNGIGEKLANFTVAVRGFCAKNSRHDNCNEPLPRCRRGLFAIASAHPSLC
jgi:hypothetical protein